MAKIDDEIEQYIKELLSLDDETYFNAVEALEKIGIPAVDALINATKSENDILRGHAAYVLSRIGDNRAYPAILDLVVNYDDPASETRYQAMQALGGLGDLRAIDVLAQIMLTSESGEPAVRWAASALNEIGKPAVKTLLNIIDSGHLDAKEQSIEALDAIIKWDPEQSDLDRLRKHLNDPDIGDEINMMLGKYDREFHDYEQIIVKIFEHCGFSYDPGEPSEPNKDWIAEIVGIPYAEFRRKIVPGYWLRSVALHLNDTRRACDDIIAILRRVSRGLQREGPSAADSLQDQTVALKIYVGEELRSHVFWFLTPSETIRDIILTHNEIESLTPAPHSRRYRSHLSTENLAADLSRHGLLPEVEALEVARHLVHLEMQCRRTRAAIDELISNPDTPADELFQRFTDVQSVMLDTAQLILRVDLIPGRLCFDE
ncbi:MAG: HEAT repeat domain-containing protein [Armatimonadota bacterium]